MYFGGALFVSLGQTVLINRLPPALAKYLPQVSPQAVINAGATNARGSVPESVLPDLILAYNQAITQVFVSVHQVLAYCSSLLIGLVTLSILRQRLLHWVLSWLLVWVGALSGQKEIQYLLSSRLPKERLRVFKSDAVAILTIERFI